MCGAATAKARLPTVDSLTGGTAKRLALIVIIYIFIRINCSIKNNKLKKNNAKRDTQRVKEHNASNAYYNYAHRKRKIT